MDKVRAKSFGNSFTANVIVILIIVAILVAIILPVFATDGYPATKVSCLSQVKQTNLASIMYAGDNNDVLPPNFSFDGPDSQTKYVDNILVYLKNKDMLLCPKEQKDIKENIATSGQEGLAGKMDYVHCLSVRGIISDFGKGNRILQLSTLKDPTKTSYLRDPIRGYGTAKDNKVVGFLSPHGGGFNIAFLDGRTKYIRNPNINSDL